MTAPARHEPDLLAAIDALRVELAELRALLRAQLSKRGPRKPAHEPRPEAAPDVRSKVRDKMLRAQTKRAR